MSTNTQSPHSLRLGDRDYLLVPVPQDGSLLQSDLQTFDSESLKKVKEYIYKPLPGGKKRIRLVRLMSGETQSQDIFCEFTEADYDKRFHIPVRIQSDERPNAVQEKYEAVNLPDYYEGDSDEETKKRRTSFENEKWEKLKKNRKAMEKKTAQEKKDAEDEDNKQFLEDFKQVHARKIDYEALSWCWGNDEPKFVVKIIEGGKTFKLKIKRELALALKYLRLPDQTRTLWIDAICINQNDADERNHQVQMMSRIYTRAEQVCVWLGEETGESKVAIDFIQKEIMELKNFDTICSDRRYTHKWQALMMLMQAVWFSRRWVVQEIALARKAVVYCGKDSIPWREFAIAVELFVEVETATHRLSEIMQKDEKFRHVPGWFEYVSELGASLLVQATGKVFRSQRTLMPASKSKAEVPEQVQQEKLPESHTIDPLERRSLSHRVCNQPRLSVPPFKTGWLIFTYEVSLEFLVSTMFIFNATEPRDAIYALLAIARDAAPFVEASFDEDDPSSLTMTLFDKFLEEKPFPIDYSRPYSDVCRDFVRFTIRRKSKLDPIQALDILCRPWALAQPMRKSTVAVQNDAETSKVSYKEKRLFPERPERIWKKRICGTISYTKDGEERQKPIKKTNDKWEEDFRTTKAYMRETQAKSTSRSSPDSPGQRPAKRWNKYEKWCDQHRRDMEAKAAGQARNVKKTEEQQLELPSWVAQAARAPFTLDHHPGMRFLKTGRANADPLVGPPSDGHRNYNAAQTRQVNLEVLKFRKRSDHYSMYVQGFELDEVDKVEDASQGGNIPVSWLKLGDWKEEDGGFTADPPDELWRTLVADRGRDNRNPPYYYARACRESVHKGSVSSGRVATTELINNERNSIVAEFCRRVHAVIWNRHMFKTKAGRLGLAYNVEKGDKVCILYGCTVPVILRTHQKKPGALAKEEFEDGKEALTACIRQWENNCLRKSKRLDRNAENRKKWILSGEWGEMMDAKRRTEAQLEKDATEKEKKAQKDTERIEKNDRNDEQRSGKTSGDELGSDEALDEDQKVQGEANDHLQAGFGTAKDAPTDNDNDTSDSLSVSAEGSQNSRGGSDSRSQGASTSEKDKAKTRKTAIEEVREEDAQRWHTFQSDCYLHGMMDGEAMRDKFYQELPDRVFELR